MIESERVKEIVLNDLLTIRQFCERYGIVYSTFFIWRKKGLIPKLLRIGKKFYIRKDIIEEWEKARQV